MLLFSSDLIVLFENILVSDDLESRCDNFVPCSGIETWSYTDGLWNREVINVL